MYKKLVHAGAAAFLSITGTPIDEGPDRLLYTRGVPKMEETPIQGLVIHHRDAMELVEAGACRARLTLSSQKKPFPTT